MDLLTLCDKIQLQPEIKSRVIEFSNDFDFNSVNKQLKGFQNYERMSEALTELQAILGEDTDNVKILSCMLKASADVYDIYQAKGIIDEIYFATIKCYPRFISETYQMTGKLYFDRYWWTTRQAGCHLFRIGELEYETAVFSIHSGIPYAASAMLPVIAPIVSLPPPRDMAFRIASSKSVLSRKAMIACGTLP